MSRHHYEKCTKLILVLLYISSVDIPFKYICNSYTMVRGDHPRALASGLSDLQVNRYGITTYTSLNIAHHELVRAWNK